MLYDEWLTPQSMPILASEDDMFAMTLRLPRSRRGIKILVTRIGPPTFAVTVVIRFFRSRVDGVSSLKALIRRQLADSSM